MKYQEIPICSLKKRIHIFWVPEFFFSVKFLYLPMSWLLCFLISNIKVFLPLPPRNCFYILKINRKNTKSLFFNMIETNFESIYPFISFTRKYFKKKKKKSIRSVEMRSFFLVTFQIFSCCKSWTGSIFRMKNLNHRFFNILLFRMYVW